MLTDIQLDALEYALEALPDSPMGRIASDAICQIVVAHNEELELEREQAVAEAHGYRDRIAELEKERDDLIHDNAQLLKAANAEATLASEALAERDALKADAERRRELCNDLANIIHDQTVAMQSALIEWKFGKGAEEGLQWIVNTLNGPGLLPDTDAEHGNNAQFWFDTHRSHPFPKCFCGNPSHTLWMGQGFCCNEHYKEAKAKYDSKAEKETR